MGSIVLDHLTKWYTPGAPVLEDATLTEEGHGAVGYLGPNGAGKTTTLKLLVGLLRPSQGRALLNGIDPAKDRRRALWNVGAVIETPEPYPSETVYDALERVGELRGLDADQIDGEVDRCNAALHLPPLGRACGGLSKGERQRVVLAAACLGDPEVLLLDEPTSGMDPGERIEVRKLLNRLKRDHLILMSSHLIGDVAEICDRLIFIDRGKIVLQETVEHVAARIQGRAMDVEFATPISLEALAPLAGLVRKTIRLTDRRYRLRYEGGDATRGQLLEECQRVAAVASFTPSVPALEEAYREIVGAGAKRGGPSESP